MAWGSRKTKRAVGAYLLGAAVIYGLFSLMIAVGTYESACPTPEWPKTWNVFPPSWDCETTFRSW